MTSQRSGRICNYDTACERAAVAGYAICESHLRLLVARFANEAPVSSGLDRPPTSPPSAGSSSSPDRAA